jgi:hypothetical protein
MKTTVNKADYEVYSYIGGYYGICKKNMHGRECIFGGDSADEDSYNLEIIQDAYNAWNGVLQDGHIEF